MKIRKIILIIACLLFVVNAFAQYKLSGVVRDLKGKPIVGAIIEATDLPIDNIDPKTLIPVRSVRAKSKYDGSFELLVPYGKHNFSVSHFDYKTAKFDIEGPNGYDVELGSVKGYINLGRSNKKKERSSWSRSRITRYDFSSLFDFDVQRTHYFNSGLNYYLGKNGAEVDYKKAFDLFMKSILSDYKSDRQYSYFYLGEMYFYGRCVEKNYQKAFEFYKISAEFGVTNAQCSLGYLYRNGLGTKINLDSAFVWYKIAAGLGSDLGQNNLGYMYLNGYGTEKNYDQALYWFRKATEQNNARAQCNLGYMYYKGYGVDKDLIQANFWYKKAADQGNAQAQYNLGFNYEYGEGVEKDLKEAILWYQKAADNNIEDAKNALARLQGKAPSLNQKKNTAKNSRTNTNINRQKTKDTKQTITKTVAQATTTQETVTKTATNLQIPVVAEQKRIALILGNGDYPLGRLPNPINDAKDISKKLGALGFKTIVRTNGQKGKTRDIIAQFCEEAKQFDAILFYYAGHAIQDQGVNFLVPINAKIESPGDIEDQCISLNWILRRMNDSGVKTKIIILDACRDNPIANSWERGITSEGLSAVGNIPEGTFLVYSAQAGKKAKDGVGKRNSPFAEAMLKALDIPFLPVHDMFHKVKNMVAEQTNNAQIPSQINNLIGDFYFNTTK